MRKWCILSVIRNLSRLNGQTFATVFRLKFLLHWFCLPTSSLSFAVMYHWYLFVKIINTGWVLEKHISKYSLKQYIPSDAASTRKLLAFSRKVAMPLNAATREFNHKQIPNKIRFLRMFDCIIWYSYLFIYFLFAHSRSTEPLPSAMHSKIQ